MFKRLIEENEGRFRMALSISGTVIEQMERHRPDVLESFQELVASGGVELLAETYYHSLAFVHSNKEFDRQVEMHLQKLEDVFSRPAARVPQHRADLQRRHRRQGRDHGLRRHHRRGRGAEPQRPLAEFPLPRPGHRAHQDAAAEHPLFRRPRLPFLRSRVARVSAHARKNSPSGSPSARATW